MRLSIARASAGGSATRRRDERATARVRRPRRRPGVGWPWRSRPSWCSAASASSSDRPSRPAPTPCSRPGQVFASVGGSQVNVYDPTSGSPRHHAQRRHQRALHRRQRVRRQRQLLRDRRHQRNDQQVLADRHVRWHVRLRADEPALTRLRQPGQPLRGPAGHALHRRVQPERPGIGQHRPAHRPARPATTGSPCRATSAPSITRPRAQTSIDLQQVHQHAAARLQRGSRFTGLTNAFELQILPNGDVLVADSESRHPARPERQRHRDLLLRGAARLLRRALRHRPRP